MDSSEIVGLCRAASDALTTRTSDLEILSAVHAASAVGHNAELAAVKHASELELAVRRPTISY